MTDYITALIKLIQRPEKMPFTKRGEVEWSAECVNYNYACLKIASDLLCSQYNIPCRELHMSDRNIIYLTMDLQTAIAGPLQTYKEHFHSVLEEEYETIWDNIVNGRLTQIYETNYSPETIQKFQQNIEYKKQEMLVTISELPNNLLNALLFQYGCGFIVLAPDFMDNVEGHVKDQNYPFQRGFMNQVLFKWKGMTIYPTYYESNISALPSILQKINTHVRTVARSAALSVVQATYGKKTLDMWEDSFQMKRDIANYAVQQMEEISEDSQPELTNRINQLPSDGIIGWALQAQALANGNELAPEYQYYDLNTKTKKPRELKPIDLNEMNQVSKMLHTFAMERKEARQRAKRVEAKPTVKQVDVGMQPDTTEFIPDRCPTPKIPEHTEQHESGLELTYSELSEIWRDLE